VSIIGYSVDRDRVKKTNFSSRAGAMDDTRKWFIVKEEAGTCSIVEVEGESAPTDRQYWGPFASREEAIARRVGLIRAGKCQPII
jgi:hypothetical protein